MALQSGITAISGLRITDNLFIHFRLSQLLKGAVVVTLCQNEAEVKCQMDIDSHISLTEQAGKIRLTELTHH